LLDLREPFLPPEYPELDDPELDKPAPEPELELLDPELDKPEPELELESLDPELDP
jgi:hypothetical protein